MVLIIIKSENCSYTGDLPNPDTISDPEWNINPNPDP